MTILENDVDRTRGQVLPITDPGLSYWQRTTRAFPLLNANRSNAVPPTSSYAVIGSGISGALTAFELIEGGVKGEDIVMLEAREAASGASSRNAGHVRPDSFRGFAAYSKVHGPEEAVKILENERLVLQKISEFVAKHDVPCDFDQQTTFDVCMTPEFAAYEAESFEAYKQAGGDVSHIQFYEGDQARDKTGIKDAVTAYEWPAGSSHPAKLAQWLIKDVVSKGVKLFTHCPVSKVTKANLVEPYQNGHSKLEAPTGALWDVSTPRGKLTTPTVIHCTNGHAALLLPQLAHCVTPNRAQAHSIVAPPAFSAERALTSTFSLRYSLRHYYSLIQRKGDGTMVLGVSRTNPNLSRKSLAANLSMDDRQYNDEIAQDGMRAMRQIFPDYDPNGSVHGEGLDHAWTGIIGMTEDSVPLVGAIDSMPGQYVCAGFNGHGMARIFTSAPGVAKLVLGKEWSETGLPECFRISEKRLEKLAVEKLPSAW